MINRITLLLFIGLAWGQSNPCDDPRYLKLKKEYWPNKGNEMPIKDVDYFLKIHEKCKEKIKKGESYRDYHKQTLKLSKEKGAKPNSNLSPCNDAKFLSIKNKSLNEMTNREYDYFMMMQEKCVSFSENNTNKKIKNKKPSLIDKVSCYGCNKWIDEHASVCPYCGKRNERIERKSKKKPNQNNSGMEEFGNLMLELIDDFTPKSNTLDLLEPEKTIMEKLLHDKRCEYDGELLNTIGVTSKMTSDGKFLDGYECFKCRRVKYFPK